MARPKKISDADAVRLVDSLYGQCGDHRRLKFSELEKHAMSLGLVVKAYDLRRNEAALQRIAEIEALELNADSHGALAYKSLDIDSFVRNNRMPDKLKRSLSELDGRWRKLFDHAVGLSRQVSTMTGELRKLETLVSGLESRNAELSEHAASGHRNAAAIKSENAFLRKMIREYLYPSLADHVLSLEAASKTSVITKAAVEDLADGDVPTPLAKSFAVDSALRSREDVLLEGLRIKAMEGD